MEMKSRLNLMDQVIIFPYRGLGNNEEVYIKGRVLENKGLIDEDREEVTTWQNIKLMYKRYESDEIPRFPVTGTFYGETIETETDDEGYFEMHFRPGTDIISPEKEWHEVKLYSPPHKFTDYKPIEASGQVLVPNRKAAYGVISDIDDTILESNITSRVGMFVTLLKYDARQRVAFPGVAAFYRQLRRGVSGEKVNPIYYVSGSSYNIYDMLDSFCEHKDIPKGPFLLKDLGIDLTKIIMPDTVKYKIEMIRRIFSYYPHLTFVLVGDSGQKDPEIYREIVQQFPGKIRAIYIRNINQTGQRQGEMEDMTRELHKWGVPMLLMDDTRDAARHAMEHGLITEEGMQDVINDANKDLREERVEELSEN
jgi:phosphatidate phosphatase APP1